MRLATLQEVMGHKKKETTLKYIHLAKTNLRAEMSQTAL
jgi:site-specific recombinase XerD